MKRKFTLLIALLLFAFVTNTMAQSNTTKISGKVTSFEESLALEGVNIHVKGTKDYTGSRSDGSFTIDVPVQNKVLIFELKDYETQEVTINGKNQYEIILKRNEVNAGTGVDK